MVDSRCARKRTAFSKQGAIASAASVESSAASCLLRPARHTPRHNNDLAFTRSIEIDKKSPSSPPSDTSTASAALQSCTPCVKSFR